MTPVVMSGESGAEALLVTDDHAPVDRSEMFTMIRSLDLDELAIFEVTDREEGRKTMFAIRNLHKRAPGKRYRSFFEFPKIYVIRFA